MKKELLPTLPGKTQGIVGMRETENGKHKYDLQCQKCGDIETPKILVMMKFKFPPCTQTGFETSTRQRLCPPCHQEICEGKGPCKGMPGMPSFYS